MLWLALALDLYLPLIHLEGCWKKIMLVKSLPLQMFIEIILRHQEMTKEEGFGDIPLPQKDKLDVREILNNA
ncbi:MAG: hypothetical protein D3905_17015 [Candidatus Electrothrix sp. AS4_5]|nr:hypothetical protein [Candidatus Electrothrix gigas]